jgi:hypothetical protein
LTLETNDNAVASAFIKPTRSPNKISRKLIKQTPSYTTTCANIIPLSNTTFHPKDHPFIINTLPNPDLKEIKLHHYSKYRYQHTNISDNEEQIIETDTENCPFEDIFDHRFTKQI